MAGWDKLRHVALNEARKAQKRAQRDARARERVDLPLILIGLAALGLVGVGAATLAFWMDRNGFADPPVLQSAPDARILENFYNNTTPIIDATLREDRPIALIGRVDGRVHSYNLQTGLFADSALPGAPWLSSDLVLLAAGCGGFMDGASEACPIADQAFAITEAGGLAWQQNGGPWQIVISDSVWVGAGGTPVEQAELTHLAASESGRWLLALAGPQGGALLDQTNGLWHVLADEPRLIAQLSGGGAQVLVRGGEFWVGGPEGLARIVPAIDPTQVDWVQSPGLRIRDLALDPDNRLLVLAEAPCAANEATCLSLRLVESLSSPTRLIGETARFPALGGDSVQHAAIQAGKIVTLGAAGVHVYDMGLHDWALLDATPVTTVIAPEGGALLVYAAGEHVTALRDAAVVEQWQPTTPVVQLVSLEAGRLLGLGENGQVIDIRTNTALDAANTALPENTVFTSGASVDNIVLMRAETGMLLHDAARRRYSWISASDLPDAFTQTARLHAADGVFWLADDLSGAVSRLVVDGDFPQQTLRAVAVESPLAPLPAPLRSVTPGPNGLSVVDSESRGYRLRAANDDQAALSPLSGPPRGFPVRFSTAAATENQITFATASSFQTYNLASRSWSLLAPFEALSPVTDIATLGTRLLYRSADGRIAAVDDPQAPLLGNGPAAAIGLAELSDAQLHDGQLYLAGAGQVQAYIPARRAFGGSWAGGSGAVRLLGLRAGLPAWISGQTLFFGDAPQSDASLLGAWQSGDGIVAHAQAPEGAYAVFWPDLAGEPTCYFRSAQAPLGRIIDAALLPSGDVVVAASGGAGIYSPQFHRWLSLGNMPSDETTRLYQFGAHLVATTATTLQALPLRDLPNASSCALPALVLEWETTLTAQTVAASATARNVAVLGSDGRVQIWADGVLGQRLPATGDAPDPASLRRVYTTDNGLAFTTLNAVWHYDLAARQWQQTRLEGLPADIIEADLTDLTPRGAALTLWSASGRSYGAAWALGQVTLRPELLTPIALPAITTPPEAILDIAQSDGFWAVASETRLELARMDAPGFTWYLDLPQPGFRPMPYRIGRSLALVEGGETAPETLWIFPQSATVPQMRGALQTLAYRYSLADDRGYLLAADGLSLTRIAANGAVYDCPVRLGDAAPQNCVETLAAPLNLNSANARIIAHGNGYLVADGPRLVWLNQQWRGALTINGPAPRPDARYFAGTGGTLLVHEGAGKALWAISPSLQPVRIAETIDQIGSIDDRIFLAEGANITELSGTSRHPLAPLAEGAVLASGLVVGERPSLHYLSARGTVHDALDNGAQIVTRLEFSADSTVILPGRWAAPNGTPQAGYWVQNAAGQVNFIYDALCADSADGTPIPCQKQALAAPFTLPAGASLRGVAGAPAAPVLLTDSQRITLPRPATGDSAGTAATQQNDPALATYWPAPDERRAQTGTLQGEIVAFGEGFELAPARIAGASSRLQLRDGAGNIHASGQSDLAPWAALNLTWLNWARDSGTITFNHSTTPLSLSPAEALRDGQFLPALPGRAAMLNASGAFSWLNEAGLWRYANSLSGPSPVLAKAFDLPTGLAHGQFLMGAGVGVDAQTGAEVQTADSRTITRDRLSISENLQNAQISATITRPDGESLNAFQSAGFVFDTRHALGWLNGQPVLVTPIGLSSLARFDGFIASPLPSARPSAIVEHEGQSYAQTAGRWFSHTANGWSEAADPLAQRRMLSAAGLHWDMAASGPVFTPIIAGETWRAQRYGNAFTADDFRAIAATPQQLVLTTALGTHALPDATALYSLPAPLAGQAPLGRLDAATLAPDSFVLFGRNEAGALVEWLGAARGWQPISHAGHPDAARRVVDGDGFTIALAATASPQALREVALIDGSRQMQAFSWQAGEHMPFDRAQALYAEGDSLLIATDFALRRLTFAGAAVTGDEFFVAPRGFGTSTRPNGAGFTQIGRPADAPEQLVALNAEGACLAFETAAATPQNCATAFSLNSRSVLATPFWNWAKSATALNGAYLLSDGTELPIDVSTLATFPHDRLQAAMLCNGQSRELWADGAILASGPLGQAPAQPLPQAPYMQLYCQTAPARLDHGKHLPAGTYVTGPFSALHLGDTDATALPATLGTAARNFARGALGYDSPNLRITTGPAATAFQHYWSDDLWRAMPLANGLPALETTLALAAQGDALLRLTPLGFVRHNQATADLSLNPATLSIQSGDSPEALAGCAPARIETANGNHQASPPLAGNPVQFTCADGSAWRMDDPNQALGALVALADNPFKTRTYINTPSQLRWDITDGTSSISLHDAPVTLEAGRFSLDNYQQIAAPFAGQLELLNPAGWWSLPAGAPHFDAATRPADFANAANVTGFARQRDSDGNPQLCATTPEEDRIIRPGQFPRLVEFCADDQGRDAIWAYAAARSQPPLATGTSLSRAAINRQLLAGRFADLTITSPPVFAGHDAEFGARYTLATPFGFVLADENFARLGILNLPHRAIALAHRDLSGASPVSGESAAEMSREVLESCPALPIAMALIPPGQTPRRAEYESDRVIRLFATRPEGGTALLRLDCQTGAIVTAADLPLGSRLRYDTVDANLPGATGHAQITIENGNVWLSGGGDSALELGTIGNSAPVSIIARGGLAVTLIVTRQSLFLIDTDAAITALTRSPAAMEETVAPMPQAAPEPTPEPEPETPAEEESEASPPVSIWGAQAAGEPAQEAEAPATGPQTGSANATTAPPRADGNTPAVLTSAQITNLQLALKARIFPALQLTGALDDSTSAAMIRFQRSISAPPTGIPTVAQYELLTGEVLP
ncbi:MAG: hypothetical protein WD046_05780 [Paracoccaceae bacterium]